MGLYDEVMEQIGKAGGPGAPPPAAAEPPAADPPDPAAPPADPAPKGMYGYCDEFQKAYGKQ